MPYKLLVFSFVETRLFTRLIQEYLTDEDYSRLQRQLIEEWITFAKDSPTPDLAKATADVYVGWETDR